MKRLLVALLFAAPLVCLADEAGKPAVTLPEIPEAPVNGPEQWRGLRVAVLGDSITDKFQTTKQRVWWQYLGAWLDWKVAPHAIPGNQWNAIDKQIDCMLADKSGMPEAIFILCGTNDYAGSVPLGTWFDEDEGPVKWWGKESVLKSRVLNRDRSTVRGRINCALERIKTSCPQAQVVLLTPLHRGASGKQPSEEAPNTAGLHLDAYVQAVREAGSVWSVPVIDLYAESGLLPALEAYRPYVRWGEKQDRLHPNSEGHLRMAKTIYYKLNALPGTF